MLTIFDNAIVILIAIIILAIAWHFSKTVTDMESYYLANRSLPWSLTVGALVATWYGGAGTLGVVEYYAIFGLSLWLTWGVTSHFSRFPLALWIGPKMQLRTDITVPELLRSTYGKAVGLLGAGLVAIYCFQFANITTIGFVGKVAWNLPYMVTAGIAVAILIFIAVAAGLIGVAVTDMLLFWCLGFSIAVIVPLQWTNLGGWEGISTALAAKPELLDPIGGMNPMTAIMLIIVSMGVYSDPTFYQRFSSSDSPATGRRALLACFSIWIMFDILLVVTGLFVAIIYPDMAPGEAYVKMALTTLPQGVRAIFIVALIGSAISALDGYFLAGATTLANDIYGKLKRNVTQSEIVFATRICVIIFGVAGLAVAFRFETAMAGLLLIGNIWMSSGFVPVVGALLYKGKKTAMGGFLGMICGGTTFLILKIFPPEFYLEPIIIALPVSFIAWVIGNRIGKGVTPLNAGEQLQ